MKSAEKSPWCIVSTQWFRLCYPFNLGSFPFISLTPSLLLQYCINPVYESDGSFLAMLSLTPLLLSCCGLVMSYSDFMSLSRIVKDLRFYSVFKLACHSFMKANQRHDIPGRGTKTFIIHSNSSSRVSVFALVLWVQLPQCDVKDKLTHAGIHLTGEQPWA